LIFLTSTHPFHITGREKEATAYAYERRTGIEKPKARAKGLYGDETEEKEEESKAQAQPDSA
jgi:hypothetical protein